MLFLAYIKNANKFLVREPVYRGLGQRYWSSLKDVSELYRNQVVVDEVTDFSPLQIASMYALTHPDIKSFFICGDFNQRLTSFGAASEDQLEWAVPKLKFEPLSVGYRQSQCLADFSRALLSIMSEEKLEVQPPEFGMHKGVQPVLLEEGMDLKTTAKWLATRIMEIEKTIDTLPSCAIFVPDDGDVQPLAESLNKFLEGANIRVKGCSNGEVIGRETEVRVFAIEHIKGLEFESAFFVKLDGFSEIEPDLFDKYLYVGTTRAATYLGLACEKKLPDSLNLLRKHFVKDWNT